MKFLDSIKTIWKNLRKSSSQNLQSITGSYYRYEDIPLKLYLEISSTRDISRLWKSGILDLDLCGEIWENIVRRSNEVNGSFTLDIYFENLKTYTLLVNEYILVKAILIKLQYVPDKELINVLRSKGYKIDPKNYAASLIAASRKSDNLITKAQVKRNEINALNKDSGEQKISTFDSVMASLSYYWPGVLSDDITLARYNECLKVLKERESAKKQKGWQI